MIKTLFIGIGTGRCGTMSLAKLINGCKNSNVFHEKDAPQKILPFEFDEDLAVKKLQNLLSLKGNVVGDVAFYYLNYLKFFYDFCLVGNVRFRVVCIERDRTEVIRSYIKKTSIGTTKPRNHWVENPELYGYMRNIWDIAYPKFKTPCKAQAIGWYWDLYFKKTRELQKNLPMLIINVKNLNNTTTQKKIFDFLRIPNENRKYSIVDENKLLRKKEN